jgi:homoserine kinase
MIRQILIQVPASTTNLGSGFDALGLALRLYLRVEISPAERSHPRILLSGEGAPDLPQDESNLIYQVMLRIFEREGASLPAVTLRIQNQIPITCGLGSSAAAIVAGISAFEALQETQLEPEKFFRYAFEFENHPDNLTASRFGGFTVSCVDEQEHVVFFRSETSPRLKILVVVPEFQLETPKARAIIPRTLNLSEAVFNLQRSSLTVAALLSERLDLLAESMRDKLHQPYRAGLIPGLGEILQLQAAALPGLRGICLSGAGPSILVLAESGLSAIYQTISVIFGRHQIKCRAFELEVDNRGRTIEP